MLQTANLLFQVVLMFPKNLFTAIDGLLDGIKKQKITDILLFLHSSYHHL